MTRRTLLKRLPAGLALASASGVVLRSQEYHLGGADIKLGVASYSFRKFTRAQAIKMTLELGTPYLNVKDFHLPLDSTPEQIDAAVKEFHDAGIILVGCGNITFNKPDNAVIRHIFEYAKRAGFPLIVCAPTHEVLPMLQPFVKEYNIKLAIHNHGPEDKIFPTPQSVLAAVKDMDPRIGCCIDVGHTARTGVNLVETIAEAGPRLLDMHFKDLADPTNPDWKVARDSQVPVGEGKLPIKQMFAQLVKMNYHGCVNLEYEIDADNPVPGMKKSFAFERKCLAELKTAA